jgi:hypothetical protein
MLLLWLVAIIGCRIFQLLKGWNNLKRQDRGVWCIASTSAAGTLFMTR